MEYFTFEVDGQRIGYYEQEDAGGVLYCNARLLIAGEIEENAFWIRHAEGVVTAYRAREGSWTAFEQPTGVYPSAAFNLLLDAMAGRRTLSYQSFDEGFGRITGELTLRRSGDRIEEHAGDQLRRYAVMKDGVVVEIGWGGTARSQRVATRAEAVAGTRFA